MNRNARITLGSVALVAALITAGCSSSTTGTDDAAPTAASGAAAEEVATAQAVVDAATEPVDEFTPPGPAFDASSIGGGTVYYVVPALEAAVFQQYGEKLKQIFAEVDVDLQQCGTSGGSPDGIANCLSQAVDAKAAAVIVMVIPYELAPTSFDAVTAAGIPLVYGLTTPSGPGEPTEVGYFSPDFVALQALNANWVIADSQGAANAIVVKEIGNPAVLFWTEQGALPTYEKGCSGCTIKTIDGGVAALDKVTTDITAALVSNPDVDYIQLPSEGYLAATISGVQASGKTTADIQIVVMDATAANITQLQQGQWLGAAIGIDIGAGAWYIADQTNRMLAGQPAVQEEQFAYERLFTRDNATDLTATDAAWASGEWYGDSDYAKGFLELWGVK
jgi:ABC-type sugar transport system substrate-binding protein